MCDTGEKRKKKDDDEIERTAKREKKVELVPNDEAPPNQQLVRNDAVHLLNIFPEELWIITLDLIKDPEELANCAKASPYFYELLKPRRVEYLLPEILPLLVHWSQHNESEENEGPESMDVLSDQGSISNTSSSDDDDDDDGVHLNRGNDNNLQEVTSSPGELNLQTLRLVCLCWCKAVVKYMLDHPSNFQIDKVLMKHLKFKEGDYDDSSDSDSESCSSECSSTGNKLEDHLVLFKAVYTFNIDDFMRNFEHFPQIRNPLFHRKLLIEDPSRWNVSKEQVRLLWECVTVFLQKYGQYIWFCEIRLQNNITGYSYYFKVREWLQLMPNLKVLDWTYPIKWVDLEDSEGNEFGSRIPIFLKCKLEDKVRENPLPKLEHLQVFKTDDLPYPIFREFIKRNDHISKLQFHRKFPPPPNYQEFYEYDFANGLKNITELSMILWRKEEIQELVISATKTTWPLLQKLSVYWGTYNATYDGFYKWSQIFNFIAKKCSAGALTNLTLNLPDAKNQTWRTQDKNVLQTPASLRLNIPQLRYFDVVLSSEHVSLDFLLPLKDSLEELQVTMTFESRWDWYRSSLTFDASTIDSSQIIQFTGYYKRMLESNIWNLFPKLKKIVLKIHYEFKNDHVKFRYYREHALALKIRQVK